MAENSNLMLFDCGHKSEPEFRPSTYLRSLGQGSVEYLFISNFDEDHISDLHNVRELLDVKSLVKNPTISADQLRDLKLEQSGEISTAMESMLSMMTTYTGGPLNPAPSFPNVSYTTFRNAHPFGNGTDTNNISLVTFLTIGQTTIFIPGDLEVAGWHELLQNPDFAQRLRTINIFVASHHGRQNGYCPEVFTEHNCRPNVIVFSDSNIVHATQEMTAIYANWATGITHNGQNRSVLTTRNDGSISWDL
jgi:beta-lactamase superfamily II metal-dependent hydrolase